MSWDDECYLLSKRKFRENANIINVFTSKKGRVAGIVYGGTSRKIRNYLQISNKLFVTNVSKNNNQIGYFKTELIEPISPNYFNDKKRISSLTSICSLLNILLPESQPNLNIYKSFEKFLNSIGLEDWILSYIFFEIKLLKELGYDVDLSSYSNEESPLTSTKKIKIDGYIYEVPFYLIKQRIPEKITNFLVKKSLIFTKNIFLNKFFIPNNLIMPKTRIVLENYYT
tara:strand:+ start:1482 stop:2162 length:681 start_codon:yes stop_codon:yes gene_type:complete